MDRSRDPVIVSAVRTAVGKAPRGSFRETRPDELAAIVISAAIERVPGLRPQELDDIILGCAFPEGAQGMNLARISSLRAGIPHAVPAMTVNRFCSSGLQSIALAADRIRVGDADAIVAGGAESMSFVPLGGERYEPNPELTTGYPEAYLGMGLTAERLAESHGITREEQDRFALRSHRLAVAAMDESRLAGEIVPVPVRTVAPGPDGALARSEKLVAIDDGPRRDTSAGALAALSPVFKRNGTVTAGNSSQMSDGAAAVVILSRARAEELGATPLAVFRRYAVAGVPPEIMGIGPVEAVPKLLDREGLSLSDIDLIELNEAFAAQALAVVRQLEIADEKLNVNGGAIALGHPLGATGAKLTVSLLHEMARRRVRRGIVTMCIGGGMGAAGLFERPEA